MTHAQYIDGIFTYNENINLKSNGTAKSKKNIYSLNLSGIL